MAGKKSTETEKRIYEVSLMAIFLDIVAFIAILKPLLQDLADGAMSEPSKVILQLMIAVAVFASIGLYFSAPKSYGKKK